MDDIFGPANFEVDESQYGQNNIPDDPLSRTVMALDQKGAKRKEKAKEHGKNSSSLLVQKEQLKVSEKRLEVYKRHVASQIPQGDRLYGLLKENAES